MTTARDSGDAMLIAEGPVDARSYASAILNILEDSASEKEQLADTQRAALNILEDVEIEKRKVEAANLELHKEAANRLRVEEALRLAKAAAEAASKELEAFSYSVAHDLRAPLRSIDGFSKALLEDYADKLDDEGREYLRMSRESAQRMAVLIDDLLMLARMTQTTMRRERVDLSALARAKVLQLQSTQPERSVQVLIADGLVADGDSHLLDVVLENLLGNAWKFTAKTAAAHIEFSGARDGDRMVFSIRDNGAGFDMAYSQKLFGVFQRLHTVSEFEGTGIGLATVQRIIARHGGTVRAEGAVDQGAIFRFDLGQHERP